MRTLDRRLLRDLRERWSQLLTIGLVVASGVGAYIALTATFRALDDSRTLYYETNRFGDVFATLERAPDAVGDRLAEIPGVTLVHTRLAASVRIPLESDHHPPIGMVVGLPPGGDAPLNRVRVEEGSMVEAGRSDEALLLEVFAKRNNLAPGDTIPVIMEGTLRSVRIVGLANAPDFVYPAPPGDAPVPDDERFAVLWMDQGAVSPAFQMEGAFNEVALRLGPRASEAAVLAEVDRILEPWGGRGAVGRDRQRSNFFLNMRFDQLEAISGFVPILFLGVAAFLLNVVLSRLVRLQRGEIAALKALGYHDREIGGYYLRFVSVVILVGSLLGVALGAWMGRGITGFFTQFFGLPLLEFRVPLETVAVAFAVALLFGFLGAFATLRRILRMAPAEAMRPEAPARYRKTLLEELGIGDLFGSTGRMVLRELGRRPIRALISGLGVALAVGIIVVGRFSHDAFNMIIDQHYYLATQEDVSVSLLGPTPERAIREAQAIPGVVRAEGVRTTPVRIRSGNRWRDIALHGYAEGSSLRRLMDASGRISPLPSGGIVLTTALADTLRLAVGDPVEVVLHEQNRTRTVPVTGLVDEMFGMQGHMRLDELNRMMDEGPMVSRLLLTVDPEDFGGVEARLMEMSRVGEITHKQRAVERIREVAADPQTALVLVLSLFGSIIAIGVVYNNTRVALSIRARDLASLRVIGFTRREISGILLGEQAIQVLLAIPVGLLVGRLLVSQLVATMDLEEYRLPLVITTETYAFAASVVLAAALASALLVRRRLDRLDLIGVLKERE